MNKTYILPKRIKTIGSKSFVGTDLEKMIIHGDGKKYNLYLRKKSEFFTPIMAHSYQYTILHALNGRKKISTVIRWVGELNRFSRFIYEKEKKPIEKISFSSFNSYTSKLNASQQKLLRSVLLYWKGIGISGLDKDLEDYLSISKPPKPRSTIEIQNSVAHERPFSFADIRKINSTIEELYIQGKFSEQDNLIWRLIISEALRPSQLNLMQLSDVKFHNDSYHDSGRVKISVALVKQVGTPARDMMIDTWVSDSIAHALRIHFKKLIDIFGQLPPPNYPLFCLAFGEKSPREKSIEMSGYISRTRKLIADALSIFDEQEFFSRRFKHTKLTHLAILGAPIEILARAGYHTSLNSLRHYTNLTEDAYENYEILMQKSHTNLLEAFRGKIIYEQEATNPDTDHQIYSTDLTSRLGACATTPCSAFAPFACYTCPRFEAFVDGAHEQVLEFQEDRLKTALKMGVPLESLERDQHLISTIKQIIQKIKELEI